MAKRSKLFSARLRAVRDRRTGACAAPLARDWRAYAPRTNALWLHYLADVLLTRKTLPLDRADKRALQAFRARAERYGCAADALADELFEGMWEAV